jgi:lysophospholipid acyltransferase (LPLAT)-like uncharacterized protein
MKKNKSAGANKVLRKDIELKLTTHLTEMTAVLGNGTKKLKKEIEKGAKKLAKKISKEITPLVVDTQPPVVKSTTYAATAPAPAAKKPVAKVKAIK